ncbi:MAG: carboxymuconolactone decarboxylase family protein [Actinobacteria bacterium]|nr:carboxymuconolactone decarboxylase family protein [Actinomycetota bacterium]
MRPRRLEPLGRADCDDAQGKLWDAIVGGPRAKSHGSGVPLVGADGGLIGPFDPLLRSPELGTRVQELGAVARFGLGISTAHAELAVCVVAATWRARFEWFAHARFAAEAGVPAEVLEAIRLGRRPDLHGDDAIVHDLAEAVVGPKHRVDDVLYARAVERLGERGTVEVVTLVGYYCMISAILNTFEIPRPDGTDDPFPEVGA